MRPRRPDRQPPIAIPNLGTESVGRLEDPSGPPAFNGLRLLPSHIEPIADAPLDQQDWTAGPWPSASISRTDVLEYEATADFRRKQQTFAYDQYGNQIRLFDYGEVAAMEHIRRSGVMSA